MVEDSELREESEVPTVVLCILVVLLVLLAAAVWVAFFSAARKALKRFAEIKRYRRRQNVLAAIANRTTDDRRSALNVFAAFPIGFDRTVHDTYMRNISVAALSVPPSYEEAMSQSVTPLPTLQHNSNCSNDVTVQRPTVTDDQLSVQRLEDREIQLDRIV